MDGTKKEIRRTPHRLTVDVTDEQWEGLCRIDWGMRKLVFHRFIDKLNLVMDAAEPEPNLGVAAILAGEIKLEDLL